MEHGLELGIAVVVCLGLACGAALRWVSKRTGFPYTVAMLLLGGLGGLLVQRWLATREGALSLFSGDVPVLSPDLILFAFLPALVFESAFALDVHAFRRNLGTVTILAVPALVVSTVLAALLVWGVAGPVWGWGLGVGLVFGALISATDPVAVVAVLRELGAPKRLSLLIEGESLLNDGTAIVAFGVLFSLLVTGAAGGLDGGATALRFVQVVAGGVAIGLLLAWLTSWWLSRTFNDPLTEITLTVVLAYSAMIVAEGLLHVSGVMAVVVAGLFMAGPGQTRISPEVRHFLHRFWEMLAYLANTLIFFLVGLVIALQLEHLVWTDLALVGAVYAGIVVIRFAVTLGFFPLLRLMREPVTGREATVMAWGGLRGAVSLALALVVSEHPALDPELRHQVLRLTAGVVLLTILVNGTTTGWLLRKLGFVTPTASERLAHQGALAAALEEVGEKLDSLSADPELAALPWRGVREEIATRREGVQRATEELRAAVDAAGGAERRAELWRRALRIERESYWQSFSEGVLGAEGLLTMQRELDLQLDALRAGDLDPPDSRTPPSSRLRAVLTRLQRKLSLPFGGAELHRLARRYDLLRAESLAAEEVIDALDRLTHADDEQVRVIRRTYEGWRRDAKEGIEDMRANLPEIVAAIEARLVTRIQLNLEREAVESLAHRGALSEAEAEAACADVESRMKRLRLPVGEVTLPETAELCRSAPIFRGLTDEVIEELATLTVEQALAAGEVLFREGDGGDAMYVVARGAIGLTRSGQDGVEHDVGTLSTGEVLGEMALLSGQPRNATATALTSVVVGRISRRDFHQWVDTRPELDERVRAVFARRATDPGDPPLPTAAQ